MMAAGILWRKSAALISSGLLAAAFVVSCGVGGPGPLEFTVTFDDAGGLEPGQMVVYNGVRIGDVLGVELDETDRVKVLVRIQPEHVSRVYREAEFLVEKPGGLMDISGERQLTMNDVKTSDPTPIENGDIVIGADSWWDQAFNRASAAGSWLYGWGENLYHTAAAWQDSTEGRAFKESLMNFIEGAAAAGQEGWQSFRDTQYPKLRESALALKQRLEDEGLVDEARELWESVTELEGRVPESEENQENE